MKKLLVADDTGWLQAFWVKDNAEDIEFGIPASPPDLNSLDWDDIKLRLNNLLVQEGFTTWQDVQKRHEIFSGLVASVVRNDIVNLYKQYETGGNT